MINIIRNWKIRPKANKSGPTRAAANGVWYDDEFGFFAIGFAVYLAAMALEQVQRSTARADHLLFH
jgi:hypothetical protein